MRSSLLGSWIDVEAAAAAAETLCAPPPVVVAAEVSALFEPVPVASNESFVSVAPPVRSSERDATNETLGVDATNETLVGDATNETLGVEATNETIVGEATNETLVMEAANETPPPQLHGRLSALRARAERN